MILVNRSQRRKLQKKGIQVEKEPVINIKASDVAAMKYNATNEAADLAFFLMLAIPVMVIHDKYPKLMKRVEDGKPREERFLDLCIDLYDSFEKGYVTIEDLQTCLWEEANTKIERKDFTHGKQR